VTFAFRKYTSSVDASGHKAARMPAAGSN